MSGEEGLSRAALAERVRANPRDAAAWSALLRHDYGAAKRSETGDVAAWKQLLLAFRTALTQLGTDQRRTPAFAQILLDEARAQIYIDALAARLSFKSVRVMPYLKSSWTAWKAALVTEAKLCDVEGVKRLLEWGKSTFPAAAPEHLSELEALVASFEAGAGCGPLSRLPFDEDIQVQERGYNGRGSNSNEADSLASVGSVSGLVTRSSSSLDVSAASDACPGHHASHLVPQPQLAPPSAVSTSFSGRPALSGAALRVPRSQALAAVAAATAAGSTDADSTGVGAQAPVSTNSSFEAPVDGSLSLPGVNTSALSDAGAEAAATAAFMRAVAARRRTLMLAGGGGGGAGTGFFPTLSPVRERQGGAEGAGAGFADGRPSTGSYASTDPASPAVPPLAHLDDLAALETSMNITHTRGGGRRRAAAVPATTRFSLSEADQSASSGETGSGSSRQSTSTAGSTTSASSVSQYSFGSGSHTGTFTGPFNVTTTGNGTTTTTSSFGNTGHGGLASSVLAASTGFPAHPGPAATVHAHVEAAGAVPASVATAAAPMPALPAPAPASSAPAPPPPSTIKKRKGVAFEVPDYIKNFGIKPLPTASAAGTAVPQAPPSSRPQPFAVPASPAPRAALGVAPVAAAAPAPQPNPRALPPWQPVSLGAAAGTRPSDVPDAGLAQPPPAKRPRLDVPAPAEERRPAGMEASLPALGGADAAMDEDEVDEAVQRGEVEAKAGRGGSGGASRPLVPHTPAPAGPPNASATSHDDSDLLISPIILKEAPSILKTNIKAPPSAVAPSQPPSAMRPLGLASPHRRLGGASAAGAAAVPFPSLVLEDEFTRQLAKAATAAAEAANASMETTRDEEDEDASEAGRPLQVQAPVQQQRPAAAVPVQRTTAPAPVEAAGAQTGAANEAPSALFDPLAAAVPGAEVVRVGGRAFLKLDCIGRGGSSRVYRVLSQDMVIYALKRVRLARMDAATIAQYSNEIGLLRRLAGHKHIIKLIAADVSYATKCIHMVMELGQTDLAKMLQEEASKGSTSAAPRLPGAPAPTAAPLVDAEGFVVPVVDENLLRLMWQQMLTGVQTIHEARIVHGDLKPANFVVVEGILKLIDFGIAKAISNDTTNIVRDTQMGTLNYMSPEAIMDVSGGAGMSGGGGGGATPTLRLGRASDIWSLGCILYQMVYGRTPFAELSLISKLHAICDARHVIPFPPVRNPHLIEVMRGCLTRDPSKRLLIGGPGGLLLHPFLKPHLAPTAPQPALPDAPTLARIVKAVAASVSGHALPEEAAEAVGSSLVRVLAAGVGGTAAPAALPPPPPGALETAVKDTLGTATLFAPPPARPVGGLSLTASGHPLHASVVSAVRGVAAHPHQQHQAYHSHPSYGSGPVTDENAPIFGGAGGGGGKLMAQGPPVLHHQQQHHHQSLLSNGGSLKTGYQLG